MCENAYLSIKNPKASRALKRALDPGRRMLASLARLRFAMSATFGLRSWGPPLDQILDPHLFSCTYGKNIVKKKVRAPFSVVGISPFWKSWIRHCLQKMWLLSSPLTHFSDFSGKSHGGADIFWWFSSVWNTPKPDRELGNVKLQSIDSQMYQFTSLVSFILYVNE